VNPPRCANHEPVTSHERGGQESPSPKKAVATTSRNPVVESSGQRLGRGTGLWQAEYLFDFRHEAPEPTAARAIDVAGERKGGSVGTEVDLTGRSPFSLRSGSCSPPATTLSKLCGCIPATVVSPVTSRIYDATTRVASKGDD
jgi:hypothetical protein